MLSTKDVIQYLNQHGNVQAIEDMAAFFSVTPRTIRNHLRSVQDAYPACLQVGRGQVKLLKQIPEESSPSAQVPYPSRNVPAISSAPCFPEASRWIWTSWPLRCSSRR